MGRLKLMVVLAAWAVLLICAYTFLLGNKVFAGKFENDGIAWYFLAKGIFCSFTLYLLARILQCLTDKK